MNIYYLASSLKIYYNIISETQKYGKEVIILKSPLTSQLFEEFVSNYQTCNHTHPLHSTPFVYVDNDGAVKLVTNVVDSMGGDDEIFALSMANDGFMEFLAFFEG